jgi:hypothetical protein
MSTATLRHFTSDELLFDQEQTFTILRYFGLEPGIQAASLNDEDRSFAQALLVEAVDASYVMGYVNIIFDTFYMKPAVSFDKVKEMTKEFLKKVAEHWFEHATKDNLRDPKIYENVRVRLQSVARSAWKIREQTGALTY